MMSMAMEIQTPLGDFFCGIFLNKNRNEQQQRIKGQHPGGSKLIPQNHDPFMQQMTSQGQYYQRQNPSYNQQPQNQYENRTFNMPSTNPFSLKS